jgi:hypothetical protein
MWKRQSQRGRNRGGGVGGENQWGPSWRGRCGGGRVRGVETEGAEGRISGGRVGGVDVEEAESEGWNQRAKAAVGSWGGGGILAQHRLQIHILIRSFRRDSTGCC